MPSRHSHSDRLSIASLLALFAALLISMAAISFAVALERSGASPPSQFALELVASGLGGWGIATLAAIVAVLGLGRLRPGLSPWIVAASAAFFVLLRLAVHFLNPELDPVATPMSLYVHARHSYLMPPSFLLATVMVLAAGTYLAGVSTSPVARTLTIVVVGILVGASVIAGVFPADPGQSMTSDASELTTNGLMHQVAGRALPLMVALPFLLLAQIWSRVERRSTKAWLLLLALTFPFAVAAAVRFPESVGLAQRFLLAAFAAWVTLACFAVRGPRASGKA